MADSEARIRREELEEYLPDVYTEYAMSVISDRAIPDVRDGLKPVQRRILYSMWEQGLTPDKPHKKSARTVGEVLGKYHPHGDQAVYETLVRLGQDFVMRHPLIDGQGNFGSIDGDPPAAMRYTEARLTGLATEFFERLRPDGSGVPWQRNFDGSTREPEVLPVPFPNLLVNGTSGIAVGMSTDVPPHNLTEILEACIHMAGLKNPGGIHWDTLLDIVNGPDFPTGGEIYVEEEDLEALYQSGEGHFEIAGRCHAEEISPKRSAVVVEELPYGVSKSKLIDEVVDLAQSDEDPGISTVRDESDRQGLRVVVECRLNRSYEIVLNNLYEKTSLKRRQRCSFLALDDGVPRTLDLREMLTRFLDFMDEVLVRNTRRRRERAEGRLHIVRGLLKALVDIDRVIEIVKQSDTPARASEALQHEFEMSEEQAEAVLDRRIRSLTGLQQMEIEREKEQLLEDLERYETLLDSPDERSDVVRGWFRTVRDQYGEERRTSLVHDELEIDFEDLRESEPVVLSWYPGGYLRRDRGDRTLEDVPPAPRRFLRTHTLEEWILFDANGQAFSFRVSEVPSKSREDRGVPFQQINSHVEEIVGLVPANVEEVLVLTRKGYVKRMEVGAQEDFESIRPSGVKYTKLEEDDRVAAVIVHRPEHDLVVLSEEGRGIRFDPSELRAMSRQARGVVAKKGEAVIGGTLVREEDYLLIQGEGTRGAVRAGDLEPQKRGGKGRYVLRPGEEGRLTFVTSSDHPRACRDGELIDFESRSKLGGQGARSSIDHFVEEPRWNRDRETD